jgi:hypothetical protein
MLLKMNVFTKLLPCPKLLQLLFALNCTLKTASFLLHPRSCSSSTASCYYSSPTRICFQSRSTTLPSAPLITSHQRTKPGGSAKILPTTRGNKKIRSILFHSGTVVLVPAVAATSTVSNALITFRNNLTNTKLTLWKDSNYILAAIVSH